MSRVGLLVVLALAAAGLVACQPAAPATVSPATATPAPRRPASPVQIAILSPTPGEVVHGDSVHVVVSITGGQIVAHASSHISPTQGIVHIFLNGQLSDIIYSTQADVPIPGPGPYSIYAEFVAADHFPFNPRDLSPSVSFTAAG
jgi:hypothetical protein